MPSFNKPTSDQIDAVVPLLSSPQHEWYFFSRLENPYWIKFLDDRDFFKHAPPAEKVAGGGYRFPQWAPSKYLARMAKEMPKEVAVIFGKIKTDNPSVYRDMLEAATAMPANFAAMLIPQLAEAAKSGRLWLSFPKASELCSRLASEGQSESAMKLADALFAPRTGTEQHDRQQRDEYWYNEGLKNVLPSLVNARAEEVCRKICGWLREAITTRESVKPASEDDYSWIWRPAIEEHEQNHDYELAGKLVGFARRAFEQAIEGGQLTLAGGVAILAEQNFLVFRRLRIHFINVFADRDTTLACQTIMTRELFDDPGVKHEYAMLVRKRLPMLSPGQRDEWFSWIETGPGNDEGDSDSSQEAKEIRARWWRYERLHWVYDNLPERWRPFYREMADKHGEPDLADLNVRVGPFRMGHESPMTLEEIKGFTLVQVLDKVVSWQPEQPTRMGPSIEGLAATFSQYVATSPEEFSRQAEVMKGRPAIYVRHFIEQMSDAAKNGKAIDVPPIIRLCQWVVDRPVDENTGPRKEREREVDQDWQWCRDTMCRFIQSVCELTKEDRPRYPLEGIRNGIAALLVPLSRGPIRPYMLRDEDKEDIRLVDFLTLAINSARGKAVEATLKYARWVAHQIKREQDKNLSAPSGFEAMPEVKTILEWQIAPTNRSFEALAIVGANLGLLNWIDRAWLEANASHIFDLQDIEREPKNAYGWAAWNTFLVWVPPHIEFYRLFKHEYAYAVNQASQINLPDRRYDQPMFRLGEHLMILYGRQQLGLDDDDGLLRRFLVTATPRICRHAIAFIGQDLTREEQKVPQEVIEKFVSLWDWYWPTRGRDDAAQDPSEFLFGPWFASGQLPDQWSLDRLEEYVQVVPTPEPDDPIVERLAKLTEIDLPRVMRVLDHMVRGDMESWRIFGWGDHPKTILSQALNPSGSTRKQALDLIDYLGRRGFVEYGTLLENSLSGENA